MSRPGTCKVDPGQVSLTRPSEREILYSRLALRCVLVPGWNMRDSKNGRDGTTRVQSLYGEGASCSKPPGSASISVYSRSFLDRTAVLANCPPEWCLVNFRTGLPGLFWSVKASSSTPAAQISDPQLTKCRTHHPCGRYCCCLVVLCHRSRGSVRWHQDRPDSRSSPD